MAWHWYRPSRVKTGIPGFATKEDCIRAAVCAGLKDGQSTRGRKAAQNRFSRMAPDEVATVWRCLAAAGWHVRSDPV